MTEHKLEVIWDGMPVDAQIKYMSVNSTNDLILLLVLKPPSVLNVKDYGAVGDGKTDDTAAIQRAIDN